MIDSGDYNGISKLFFGHAHYNSDKENYALIYVVTMIYLYYLAKREKLVEDNKLCEYANKILADNHKTYSYFYFDIDLLQLVKNT